MSYLEVILASIFAWILDPFEVSKIDLPRRRELNFIVFRHLIKKKKIPKQKVDKAWTN